MPAEPEAEAGVPTPGDAPHEPSRRLLEMIRTDLDRFTQTFRLRGQPYSPGKVFWESFFFKASFQAAMLYRISHWFFQRGWIYPAWFVTRMNLWLTGAEIEFNARIGPGLFITHPVGVVIGRGTVIGSGATIFQGTTFGVRSWHPDEIRRFPVVGNNCFFFAHCVVLGGVRIGDGSIVAAQALVNRDMPPGSLAKGSPAEIVPDQGRDLVEAWFN